MEPELTGGIAGSGRGEALASGDVRVEAEELLARCEKELESVMGFWLRHSHDTAHGGFYNCLSKDGQVYDTLKYCWMQGRQVWMYSKLYNTLPSFHTTEVLEAAERGGQFLISFVRVPRERRCFFTVTACGKPVQLQRKPYSEAFYTIAMAELHRATGKQQVQEFCGQDKTERERYGDTLLWCRQEILKHCHGQWVLERVAPDGSLLEGCSGRLTCPGHAMEAGWFMLQEALSLGDEGLAQRVVDSLILNPHDYGWDREYGGLLYFLDSEGHSPVQLEWPMKLWWVQCEGMVALLMAFRATGSRPAWARFSQLCQYTFSKFADRSGQGEWFGYLTREGKVNQTFKGGPYKGCFHIPRCLLLCVQVLRELVSEQKAD